MVLIPDQCCGLAAWDAGGPIVQTAFDTREWGVTLVRAVDLRRKVLWERRVRGRPYPPRLTGTGTLWVANRSPTGVVVMNELDRTGRRVDMIRLDSDRLEVLGAFVAVPDGIVALWLPAVPGRVLPRSRREELARWLPTKRGRSTPRRRHARLARHDRGGATRWSTSLPLIDIPGGYVVRLGHGTGGEIRREPPWTPNTLMSRDDPLLISGSRVAATVACFNTGAAVTFFVSVETGQLLGQTAPGRSHSKAIAGPGEFLIGYLGHPDRTAHYDAAGAVVREWQTHAQILVGADGVTAGAELKFIEPSQSHFVRLRSDGTVEQGPALSGSYTTYPALDRDGTSVFWRDGVLHAVDADLRMRELAEVRRRERALPSRALLLEDGHVVFTLDGEVIVHREPALGPLNEGVWPCGEGGLRGNPVLFYGNS